MLCLSKAIDAPFMSIGLTFVWIFNFVRNATDLVPHHTYWNYDRHYDAYNIHPITIVVYLSRLLDGRSLDIWSSVGVALGLLTVLTCTIIF